MKKTSYEVSQAAAGEKNVINAKTQLVALIGDPVKHSLSPAMHNAAFSALKMNWAYVAAEVKTHDLPTAVAGLRALQFQGFNSTMPHKQALVQLVDQLDPFACFCQAVNTVTIRNGRLHGYNTDGPGALKALQEANADLSRAIVLGAGAAGSAMALALTQVSAQVTILNREARKAESLAQKIAENGAKIQAGCLDEAADHLANATVVCNATSVGMNTNESPIPKTALHSGLSVLDAVYAPRRTRLIQDAENVGAKTITGDQMLLQQGMIGFELWTGGKAPKKAMEKALESVLEAKNSGRTNGEKK